MSDSAVRVRFCPSPTGNPPVGMVRPALFNWAYARHTGGTFVFRIEDTDSARDSEQSYEDLLGALRWRAPVEPCWVDPSPGRFNNLSKVDHQSPHGSLSRSIALLPFSLGPGG